MTQAITCQCGRCSVSVGGFTTVTGTIYCPYCPPPTKDKPEASLRVVK